MTSAQPAADSGDTRDLADAAVKRDLAKVFIEQYKRDNGGALPSGVVVGERFGMTGKWGQNQLKAFRPVEDAPAGGASRLRNGTVADLVAERNAERNAEPDAAPPTRSPATVVIEETGTERPPARSGAAPAERPAAPAARPERSAAASGTPAGASTGTAKRRSGTPDADPTGTPDAGPTGTLPPRASRLSEFFEVLPILAIAAGAFVSIWGGWVGLGKMTGFGPVELLPGIAPGWTPDTAVTLPLGMEAYAGYALKVWLAPPPGLSEFGRTFARRSTIASLTIGVAGQVAYHLMAAAGVTEAPPAITAFVSALPVIVLGFGAALLHLVLHARRARR